MTQSNKDEIYKKWAPILNNIGLTGSKANWMAEYAEIHSKQDSTNITEENTTFSDFPTILPMAMKVAARTMTFGASKEEIDEVKNKVLIENRDGKIDAVIEGKEFTEKKLEDDEEYQNLMKKDILPVQPLSSPRPSLFYLDFKYESGKKTRRSGKKHKKKNNDNI